MKARRDLLACRCTENRDARSSHLAMARQLTNEISLLLVSQNVCGPGIIRIMAQMLVMGGHMCGDDCDPGLSPKEIQEQVLTIVREEFARLVMKDEGEAGFNVLDKMQS